MVNVSANTKKKLPLVTVFGANYNTFFFIKDFMESVLKTKYPNFEVLIIDDHSTDGSYEWLVNTYKNNSKVRIIRNKTNLRLGKTRTKGIQMARGKYVAIMDVDTKVDPNWLTESVKTLEEEKAVSGVQTVIYDLIQEKKIACGGLRLIPSIGWMIMYDFGEKYIRHDKNYEVFPGITGVIYRKEIFKKIGFFDNKIGFNIDDVDFGIRFALAGFRCFVNPNAITYHMTFKTKNEREKGIKRLEWEFNFMKMPRIFIKNYEIQNVLLFVPVVFFVYLLRSISWVIRGDMRPFFAFCWSFAWHIKTLPDSLHERRKVQNLRKISDEEVFRRISYEKNNQKSILRIWWRQMQKAYKWKSKSNLLSIKKIKVAKNI